MNLVIADYRSELATQPQAVEALADDLGPIVSRLDTYGFAIVDFAGDPEARDAIQWLAEGLSLGNPVVPAFYRKERSGQFKKEFAEIKADDRGDHPGFSARSAQDFHVDGTLDDPEDVPTVVMFCVQEAASGGASLVFNSAAAFHALRESDAEAARALTAPKVMRRTASMDGGLSYRDGPAFRVHPDGRVVNRYCEDGITSWHPAPGDESALMRALEYLTTASHDENGPFRARFVLRRGQALILRNDKVSHGREAYEDGPEGPRALVRGVFGRVPR
ncbi:TauD/TfdA family dioxygenase [Streptomyces sp. bgisy034]|uniref:TauD/TfdA family dioxygenase n=1 Tax=Streptomyces sp. bgisy034 TaxID=3413774 RepID=UPI003EBAE9C3